MMPEAITITQNWIDFFRIFGGLIFGVLFGLVIGFRIGERSKQ